MRKRLDVHLFMEKNLQFWRKPQFRSLYTVYMVIETKVVIGWFKLQLWMWLAYCLSNNNLARELVETGVF